MYNVHAVSHRMTALSMACLASAGFIFCALAGFSCDYLKIEAQPGRSILTPSGTALLVDEYASIGIQCDSPFYEEEDRFWNLSRLFLYIGTGLGGLTALVAWVQSTCLMPSEISWRLMSLLAACAAVMEVPIFLIYESEPCNFDISRQTCSLSIGSYYNIASVGLFVVMTLLTQYIRSPDWQKETRAWQRGNNRQVKVSEIDIPHGGTEDMGTEEESSPREGAVSPAAAFITDEAQYEEERKMRRKGSKRRSQGSQRRPRRDEEAGFENIEVVPPMGCDLMNLHLSADASVMTSEALDRQRSVFDDESNNQSQQRSRGSASFFSAIRKTFQRKTSNPANLSREVEEVDNEDEETPADICSPAATGVQVTIICPDGRKESVTSKLPTCDQELLTDAQLALNETAGMVRNMSLPANQSQVSGQPAQARTLPAADDDKLDQEQEQPPPPPEEEPETDASAPIAHLAIIPATRSEDDVSEMTPLPDTKKSRKKKKKKSKSKKVSTEEETEEAMKILEDLAKLEE